MSNLLFLLTAMHTAGCPQPRLVNWTTIWTQLDNQTYVRAFDRCKVHFGDATPCLKTFIKKKERTYYVVCSVKSFKNTAVNSGDRRFYFTTIPAETKEQPNSIFNSASDTSKGQFGPLSTGRKDKGGGE